jgi:uncharacterized protein (TIGR03435 family)
MKNLPKLRIVLAVLIVLGVMTTHLWAQAQKPTKTPTTAAGALPTFDAASIKSSTCPRKPVQFEPGGRIVAPSVPAKILIGLAYGLPFSAFGTGLIGAPEWVGSQCYEVEAHAEGDPPREQMVLMLRSLLATRFKLITHWETRQLPVYALVVAKQGKTGPHLVPHAADNSTCRDLKDQSRSSEPNGSSSVSVPCGGYLISPGHIVVESTLADLAKGISWYQGIDRVVVDQTGLNGIFEITIDYDPSLSVADTNSDSSLPSSIFTAFQEQLGLRLESAKGPVDVLVIDHIEEPTPN